MDLNSIPRPADGFHIEEMDGEFLLYHPGGDRIVQLNATAALVWRLCDGKRSLREIIVLLKEAYPDSADDVMADVPEVMTELAENGCVHTA